MIDRVVSTALRDDSPDFVAVRVLAESVAQTHAEVVVVPWDDSWTRRARIPNAVPREWVESLAIRQTTDGEGFVRLPRMESAYVIGARASGYSPCVRLASPAESEIDLSLVRGVDLEVCAIDHSNQHVPGAVFEAFFDSRRALALNPEIEPEKLIVLPLFTSTAEADSDFVGRIAALPEGPHCVIARHPSYADSISWGLMLPMTTKPYFVSLEAKAFVAGSVRRRSDNAPIPGARVEIRHSVGKQPYGDSCSVLTRDDGSFVCENAWGSPEGDLEGRALCWKEGYGVQVVSCGALKPGERKHIAFLLDEAAIFFGRVEGSDGAPRAGITVSAGENSINLETTTTRADGTFTMHSLAKNYSFYFHVSGAGIATCYPTAPSPWPAEWPFIIRVDSTYDIAGRLIADGYPIVGARVRAALEATRASRLHETWVDADPQTGVFRFESLPPGRYYFDAIAAGYSPNRVRGIEVGETTTNDLLEVHLDKGCRVRGVVKAAATGKLIDGAKVGLADFGELTRGKFYGTLDLGVVTDLDGRFEIESVEAGREVVLSIERDGYARTLDRFTAEAAATSITREIRLFGAGRLEVTVIRPDGQPAGDFDVIAVDPSGGEQRASGATRVTLEGLSPTPHRVTIALRDAVGDFRGSIKVFDDVVIREGEKTSLSVSFADGLTIRGSILGNVAREYSGGFGAYAYLWKDDRWHSNEFCEVRRSDLGFSIFGLEPGTYKVQVESLDRQPMLSASRVVELTPDNPCLLDFEFGEFLLEGVVTDAAGGPIVGADLALSPEDDSLTASILGATPGAIARATSASDGRYAVAGLVTGPYRARIDADGYARLRSRVVVDERETIAKQDFELDPECKLRVEVVDRGGMPLSTRKVTVRPFDSADATDEYDATRRDSDGFTIVRGVGTGSVDLAVEAVGFFPHRATIACVAGAPLDVRVALRRLAFLRVIARDAIGAPLKNVPFSIVDLETGDDVSTWITDGRFAAPPNATTTDDSGAIRIEGLPEGRYRVIGYGIDEEIETTFDADAKPSTLTATR